VRVHDEGFGHHARAAASRGPARAPGARLVRASFVDVDLSSCAGIACIGEVLGSAFDPRAGREALRAWVLRRYGDLRLPRGPAAFAARPS
jgi:hypothetical protein